jgi:chemosensory pili system protein ChpA (sensor histidine kinase/response regulator)
LAHASSQTENAQKLVPTAALPSEVQHNSTAPSRRETPAPRSLDVIAAITADLLAARVRLGDHLERLSSLTRRLNQGQQRLGRSMAHAQGRRPAKMVAAASGGLLDELDESGLEWSQALSDHERQGRGLSELFSLLDGLQAGFGESVRALEGLRREVEVARRVRLARLMQALEAAARDTARREGKRVHFESQGRDVEVDQELASELLAPLTHLVRNAVGHGIESEGRRLELGKPAQGCVSVQAHLETGRLVLELSDDGRGLDLAALRYAGIQRGLLPADVALDDPRIPRLIFVRGLSTRAQADEVAGRGLGCDEVENALAALGGQVEVSSQAGRGTRFRLTVPLERQLVRLLAFRVGDLTCALPSTLVERVGSLHGQPPVIQEGRSFLLDEGRYVPAFALAELFGQQASGRQRAFVALRLAGQSVALLVDGLESERAALVKPLGDLLAGHALLNGVAAWSLDRLALLLDPRGLSAALAEEIALSSALGLGAVAAESVPAASVAAENAAQLRPTESSENPRPSSEKNKTGASSASTATLGASPSGAKASTLGSAPGAPANPGAQPQRANGPTGAQPLGRCVRVLYVDDSLAVRRAAGKYLKECGFDFELAMDGLDALSKLDEGPVDLVFTDLEMPRMNGYDLLKELRQNPRHAQLPLLVVTSRSSEKHREEARRLGANGYLSKPYTQADLARLICQHVPCQTGPDGQWRLTQ